MDFGLSETVIKGLLVMACIGLVAAGLVTIAILGLGIWLLYSGILSVIGG